MFVSGFTFIRNGIRYDYPFLESIRSALDLCDEYIIMAGRSDDGTREALESLDSGKIRVIDSDWDDTLREGGRVLAAETNKALDRVNPRADWALYLQGDEVIHEKDHPAIRQAMQKHKENPAVEGLLFSYIHFYASYKYVGDSRRWYRREIRVVRNDPSVRSWKDAQGFRKDGRKLRVKPVHAGIYHYGWVKSPATQQLKQKYFNRYWHNDAWLKKHVGEGLDYDYTSIDSLVPFSGSHPGVMAERVAMDPGMHFNPGVRNFSLKDRFLYAMEKKTGWRPGEYRNYVVI